MKRKISKKILKVTNIALSTLTVSGMLLSSNINVSANEVNSSVRELVKDNKINILSKREKREISDRIERSKYSGYGVTRVDLTDFIYYQYHPKEGGTDYYFYGAGLELVWTLPDNAKEGNYFDLILPDEVLLDKAPSKNVPLFQINAKDSNDVVLDVYKIDEKTLRFVATDYVNTHKNLSGTAVIGEVLDSSKITGFTDYDGYKNSSQTAGRTFVSGFRPNKKLFKNTEKNSKFEKELTYIAKYQDSDPREIKDRTRINYVTEVNSDDNRFGLATIYAIKEDADSITWALVYDARGELNRAGTIEISSKGFAAAYGLKERTVELYNKDMSNIKVYKGTPSGSIVPNNLVPTNEVEVVNRDNSSRGNGDWYQFNFPKGSYYVEIKTKKIKKIKDNNDQDAYKMSLYWDREWYHRDWYVDEYYHPTDGFGRAIGVNKPIEEAPPIEEKKGGDVDVKYVTVDGTELEGVSVVKHEAPIDEAYTTEKKEFPGYTFVKMDETSAPANGKVKEEVQHVIYVYDKKKGGDVDVKYVTVDGTELEGVSVVKHEAPIDEAYTTEKKEFPGYTFVKMDETSAPANGKVKEEVQHVIYVYDKKKGGDVDVKYVTVDGTELEGVSVVKHEAPIDEAYTTEKKEFPGYTFVKMDETSAPANGKVKEEVQHVIYVYKPVEPPVEPEKPVTPPVNPEEPEKPVTPPVEPEKPVTPPVNPEEPVTPPVNPEEPVTPPVEPEKPVTPPVEPEKPVTPPVNPEEPVTPPVEPEKPVTPPVDPEKPVTPPVEPEKPVTPPVDPEKPVTPVEPEKPVTPPVNPEEPVTPPVEPEKPVTPPVDPEKPVTPPVNPEEPVTPPVDPEKPVVPPVDPEEPVTPPEDPEKPVVPPVEPEKPVVPPVDPEKPVVPKKGGDVDVKYVTVEGKELQGVTVVKHNSPVGETYVTEEKKFPGYRFVRMAKNSAPANGKVKVGSQHIIYVYEKVPMNVDNNRENIPMPKTGVDSLAGTTMLTSSAFAGIVALFRRKKRK